VFYNLCSTEWRHSSSALAHHFYKSIYVNSEDIFLTLPLSRYENSVSNIIIGQRVWRVLKIFSPSNCTFFSDRLPMEFLAPYRHLTTDKHVVQALSKPIYGLNRAHIFCLLRRYRILDSSRMTLPRFSGHNPIGSKGSRSVQNEERKTSIYARI